MEVRCVVHNCVREGLEADLCSPFSVQISENTQYPTKAGRLLQNAMIWETQLSSNFGKVKSLPRSPTQIVYGIPYVRICVVVENVLY